MLESVSLPEPSSLRTVAEAVRLCTPIKLPLEFLAMREHDCHLDLLVIRERRIRLLSLLDADLSRENKPRLRPPTLNKAQQRRRQHFRIYRPSLHTQALGPEVADGKADIGLTPAGSERRALGAVLSKVHANDANAAAVGRQLDGPPQHDALVWLQRVVDALEAHAVARPRHAVGLQCQDLRHRVAFGEVDGRGADGARLFEARVHVVDAEYLGGAAEERAVGAQKAHGTCSFVSGGLGYALAMKDLPAPKTATLSPG